MLPSTWRLKSSHGNLTTSTRTDQLNEILRQQFASLDEVIRLMPSLNRHQQRVALTEAKQSIHEIERELLNLDHKSSWENRLTKARTLLHALASSPVDSEEGLVSALTPFAEPEIRLKSQPPAPTSIAAETHHRAQMQAFSLPSPRWDGYHLPAIHTKQQAIKLWDPPTTLATPANEETANEQGRGTSIHSTSTPRGSRSHRIRLPLPGPIHHFKRGPGIPQLTLAFQQNPAPNHLVSSRWLLAAVLILLFAGLVSFRRAQAKSLSRQLDE